MAFSDIEAKECLCAWVTTIEPIKNEVLGVLTSAIVVLQATKAAILLYPANLEDKVRKVALEAALMAIEQPVKLVEQPITVLISSVTNFTDCAPMNSLTKVLKNFRDKALSDVDELRFEIQQYIATLDDSGSEVDQIDRWITLLQDIQTAITDCKAVT